MPNEWTTDWLSEWMNECIYTYNYPHTHYTQRERYQLKHMPMIQAPFLYIRIAWAQNDNVHSLLINSTESTQMHIDNTLSQGVRARACAPDRQMRQKCWENKMQYFCLDSLIRYFVLFRFVSFCSVCSFICVSVHIKTAIARTANISIGQYMRLIINFSERKLWN